VQNLSVAIILVSNAMRKTVLSVHAWKSVSLQSSPRQETEVGVANLWDSGTVALPTRKIAQHLDAVILMDISASSNRLGKHRARKLVMLTLGQRRGGPVQQLGCRTHILTREIHMQGCLKLHRQ